MQDDLMCEFEECHTTHEMWPMLKEKYGGTSTANLRGLNIKFDSFKKLPKKSMRQHLRKMLNMICELKNVGHVLIDKQHVQAIIQSFPDNWEHMRVNSTHNDSSKHLIISKII